MFLQMPQLIRHQIYSLLDLKNLNNMRKVYNDDLSDYLMDFYMIKADKNRSMLTEEEMEDLEHYNHYVVCYYEAAYLRYMRCFDKLADEVQIDIYCAIKFKFSKKELHDGRIRDSIKIASGKFDELKHYR